MVIDYETAWKSLMRKYTVVCRALRIAGKYARTNLPMEVPTDKEYLLILCNGDERDPNGIEYVEKWLYDAEQELKNSCEDSQ